MENEQEVSILVPIYNRLELLSHTLLSVQAQTYPYWIAYLCDDGSTEDVNALLSQFVDPRFHYHRLAHEGIGSTRNRALKMANSIYTVMLDSDDVWHPEFLAKTVRFLKAHSEVDLVQTAQGLIDYKGAYLARRNPPLENKKGIEIFDGLEFLRHDALTYFLTEPHGQNNLSSLVMRTDVAQRVQMAEIDFMEDWDYWVRIGKSGAQLAYLNEELCYFRTYEREVNIPRQTAALRNTIHMVQSHAFPERWQQQIQRTIVGNLYDMIAFNELAEGHRKLALAAMRSALVRGVDKRRMYGLLRCVAPGFASVLKQGLTKARSMW